MPWKNSAKCRFLNSITSISTSSSASRSSASFDQISEAKLRKSSLEKRVLETGDRALEPCGHLRAALLCQINEDRFLAGIMQIDGGGRDAGAVGDLAVVRAVIALGREQRQRRRLDPLLVLDRTVPAGLRRQVLWRRRGVADAGRVTSGHGLLGLGFARASIGRTARPAQGGGSSRASRVGYGACISSPSPGCARNKGIQASVYFSWPLAEK